MKRELYLWFDSAEAYASSAATLFTEFKWRRAGVGVPGKPEILKTLLRLSTYVPPIVETGRLAFFNGKFGHLKPQPLSTAKLQREIE